MLEAARIKELKEQPRIISRAEINDPDLDLLKLLPGKWSNTDALRGRGYNMIALPYASGDFPFNYRLLVNQYNEVLNFTIVDKGVKNRGISRDGGMFNADQVVVALDYEQVIKQSAADDFPRSGLAGGDCLPIHHEPGLWLFQTNESERRHNLARLASIPHGDSLLALGSGTVSNSAPSIPDISGIPTGVHLADRPVYLAPYFHFESKPFKGKLGDPRYQGADPAFSGFNPVSPSDLLKNAVPGNIVRTTELRVSTRLDSGGIVNIPFITRQANASEMNSIFWIVESEIDGVRRTFLQYLQIVTLDFFDRFFDQGKNRGDGMPGPAHWPHVAINTMEKIKGPNGEELGPEPTDECRPDDA